jgi:hypothetical protein
MKPEIDLQQFCSKNKTRPYIAKPFSFGEFSYATTGYIIVRVARRPEIEEGAAPIIESGCIMALSFDPNAAFKSLPPFSWPADKSTEDCYACDGRGTEHDCPNCRCPCPKCDGTGKALNKYSISVCGVEFNGRYIKQISSLPGFQIAEKLAEEGPASFRFDGGVGAIMPLRGGPQKYDPCYLGNIEDAPK